MDNDQILPKHTPITKLLPGHQSGANSDHFASHHVFKELDFCEEPEEMGPRGRLDSTKIKNLSQPYMDGDLGGQETNATAISHEERGLSQMLR